MSSHSKDNTDAGKRKGHLDRLRQTYSHGYGRDRGEGLVHMWSEGSNRGKGVSASDGNRKEGRGPRRGEVGSCV